MTFKVFSILLEATLKGKNMLPRGSIFFPLRLAAFEKHILFFKKLRVAPFGEHIIIFPLKVAPLLSMETDSTILKLFH